MSQNYTRAANERCLELNEQSFYDIWDEIENTDPNASPAVWQETLNRIACQYSCSSRFALMRLVCHRATGKDLDQTEQPEPFSIHLNGREYRFSGLSMEIAENLPQAELEQYGDALMDLASSQANHNPDQDRLLICHALSDSATYTKLSKQLSPEAFANSKAAAISSLRESMRPITRADAMRLGHILGMTPQEVQWFLLRVFDYEDGLRYNSSSDLIDTYGFLTGIGWQRVEELKKEYLEKSSQIPKASLEQRPMDWTSSTGDSLPALVESWSATPDTQQDAFFKWLLNQAAYLDTPSATALRLYRTLAVYACRLIEHQIKPLESGKKTRNSDKVYNPRNSNELHNAINEMCRRQGPHETAMTNLLFPDGQLSREACTRVANEILMTNKTRFFYREKAGTSWRTLSVKITVKNQSKIIKPTAIMAGHPDAKPTRVKELLCGEHQVEKGDMLSLLWFTYSIFWENHRVNGNQSMNQNLRNFTSSATDLLDAALLPAFYPPHIMEQTMMLSITFSVSDDNLVHPADVYALILEKLVEQQTKRT